MRHSKHFFRAGILIIGGFFAFLVVRSFLLPKSWGEFGHYRGDNVKEQSEKPISFGAPNSCADCHADVMKKQGSGKHHTVQCQNCHAPLSVHIKDGNFQEAMPINRSATLCLRCHDKLPSRPARFPQIEVKEHLETMGMEWAPGVCLNCHNPHDPLGSKKS